MTQNAETAKKKKKKKRGKKEKKEREEEEREMEMQKEKKKKGRCSSSANPGRRADPGRSATQAGAHLGPVSVSEVFFFSFLFDERDSFLGFFFFFLL